MSDCEENSPPSEQNNTNLYPYNPIRLNLKELLKRFGDNIGVDYIPLVLWWGTKKPICNDWESLSWNQLCDLKIGGVSYLDRLCQKNGDYNIGIREGPDSGHLIGIDIDTDDRRVTDQFLEWNKFLKETLWTRGAHGHHMWVRIKGDYPAKLIRLEVPGISGHKPNSPAVEIRAGSSKGSCIQSVIWGRHQEGPFYSVVNDKPILEIEWSQLHWEWKEFHLKKQKGLENKPLEWAGDRVKRLRIVEELYGKALSVSEDGHRVDIVCVNEENHGKDTGERQCSISLGTGSGEFAAVWYNCFHASCADHNKVETARIKRAFAQEETVLYSPAIPIHETQGKAYRSMAETGVFFNLNEQVAYWIKDEGKLEILNALTIDAALSRHGIIITRERKGIISVFRFLGEEPASLLAKKDFIRAFLPEIKFTTNISFLGFDREKKEPFEVIKGYHSGLKCLCLSEERLLELSTEEAWKIINGFFSFWEFETGPNGADRARALAMFCSPMEVIGGWLSGRPPCHVVEADQLNAGKTSLLSALCYTYAEPAVLHDMKDTPIGGLCQLLDHAIAEGDIIFCVDNIKGDFDISRLEMMITSPDARGRIRQAYHETQKVDYSRLGLFFTGNEGFKFTPDLASRTNVVKIKFKEDSGGLYEAAMRLKDPGAALLLRSALAQIMRASGGECAPVANLFRFTEWARFNRAIGIGGGLVDLTEGIIERQKRIQQPELIFLEQGFELLKKLELLPGWGSASQILKVLEELGLEWPNQNGKSPNVNALAARFAKLVRSQRLVREKIHQFGNGYAYLDTDTSTNTSRYYLSPELTDALKEDYIFDTYFKKYER